MALSALRWRLRKSEMAQLIGRDEPLPHLLLKACHLQEFGAEIRSVFPGEEGLTSWLPHRGDEEHRNQDELYASHI